MNYILMLSISVSHFFPDHFDREFFHDRNKMYIILEWNGLLPEGFMGAMINESGEIVNFDNEYDAIQFAKENCAFEYKIVEL